MNLLLLQGWVEPIDASSIDTSAINPSALEKLIENAAPSVQKLVFNIIASIIIFVVGRKLISLLLKILDKFLSHVEMDIGVNKFLQAAARMLLYTLLVFMIVGQLGVNTASIVTILGAGGLAISMSLQGSLSNVAGGILILLSGRLCEYALWRWNGPGHRAGLHDADDDRQPQADHPQRRALQCSCVRRIRHGREKTGHGGGYQL